MTEQSRSAALAWSALMLAGTAPAAGAVPAAPAGAGHAAVAPPAAADATLAGKLRLVRLLLAQSPAVQRIPHSGNVQAQFKLRAAREQLAEAEAACAAGAEAQALPLLDSALRHIVAASALVPDVAAQDDIARRRYLEVREALQGAQQLQQKVAPQGGARPAAAARGDALLASAEARFGAGDVQQANALLAEAYQAVAAHLAHTLGTQTVVHGLQFATPADEYRHELARVRGYEELMPIALAQFRPSPQVAAAAGQLAQRSHGLQLAAVQLAASGAYPSAIATLQEATGALQRALQYVGVVVPSAAGAAP